MMVYVICKDDVLLRKLEADFCQYYPSVDFYSFFRGEMYFRRFANLISELPDSSRVAKWQRNDPMTADQHLLMSISDGMNILNYQTYYVAGGTVGKEYKNSFKKAPKPMKRPTYREVEEEKPKPRFLSGRELKAMMGGEVIPAKYTINHNQTCIKMRTTTDPNCGCERTPLVKMPAEDTVAP